MPKEFEKCRKEGGRIRTIQPNEDTNLPICFPKKGGPSVAGETKKSARDKLKKHKLKSNSEVIANCIFTSKT